jgi:hypothetical protein
MLLESPAWNSPAKILEWRAKPLMVRMEIQNMQLCLMGSAETLKESAMRFSRLLFQLAPSEPRTEGTGCGLLHTPSSQEPGVDSERLVTKDGEPAKVGERAYDRTTGRLAQVGLPQQIGMLLKTPSASEAEGGAKDYVYDGRATDIKFKLRGQIASTQIAMLPTPNFTGGRTAPDTHKQDRRNKGGKCGGDDLATAVGTSRGLKLQPAFVEWMMGYPLGFTDIEFKGSRPSATPSSPKSRSRSSKPLPK